MKTASDEPQWHKMAALMHELALDVFKTEEGRAAHIAEYKYIIKLACKNNNETPYSVFERTYGNLLKDPGRTNEAMRYGAAAYALMEEQAVQAAEKNEQNNV